MFCVCFNSHLSVFLRHCDNFMCQLDWAAGCTGVWLNVVLGMSVRVILDETRI